MTDNSTTPALQALSELENGAVAVVEEVSIEANGHLRRRLMEMGLVRGTRVRLVKRAPFGDTIPNCLVPDVLHHALPNPRVIVSVLHHHDCASRTEHRPPSPLHP